MDGGWLTLFSDRETKEILFAQLYAKDFNHGTTGHNQLLVIAKLCEMLTRIEESGVRIPELYYPKESE